MKEGFVSASIANERLDPALQFEQGGVIVIDKLPDTESMAGVQEIETLAEKHVIPPKL